MAFVIPILQGVEAIAGAQNQANAEKYNEVVAAENAKVAQMRGDLNVQEIQKQDRYEAGARRAAYSGSGVTMTGTPMDEMADQAINDSFKQQVARFNGLVNVGADEASAGLASFLAGQETTAGYLNAVTTGGNYLLNKYYSPPESSPPSTPSGGDSGASAVGMP